MQGRQNFAASLAHYNRAIELKPGLAQAYMYRGVLFMQQGDTVRARQDLERLRRLDAKLAADLERVVEGAAEGPGARRRRGAVRLRARSGSWFAAATHPVGSRYRAPGQVALRPKLPPKEGPATGMSGQRNTTAQRLP